MLEAALARPRQRHAYGDPDVFDLAAAYTAAGMLAPYTELESAESLIYELGQRSLSLWPDIVAQLDAPEVFHSGGSLAVAHGQDAADLEHFNQLLARKLPGEPGIAFLDRQGLAELEPELAFFCSKTGIGSGTGTGTVLELKKERIQNLIFRTDVIFV